MVIEKFNVLNPSLLNKVSDDKLYSLSVRLKDNVLKMSVSFQLIMKEVIKNKVAILFNTTICEHATLSSNFPEVCTAYIPVSYTHLDVYKRQL